MLFALGLAPASAQDAARGRALYADICARCHSDPPGSGAINPLVRTADQIRAAINRVSPMRFLGDALPGDDLASIAAYFVTVLGPPTDGPGIYTAKLFRNSGPPYATPPGSGAEAPNATEVGTIALVFTDRDNAEVTFVLAGIRVAHKIGRVALPP